MKHIDFLQGLMPASTGAMLTYGTSQKPMAEDSCKGSFRGMPQSLPAGHFSLGQNFPNPHYGLTTIPVTLSAASDLLIGLYDLDGHKVKVISRPGLRTGDHTILIDLAALGLPSGDYTYQMQVTNNYGVFRQSKLMTAAE